MKRPAALLLSIIAALALAGCEQETHTEADYPAAIMVEGSIYFRSSSPMPAEVDPNAIIGHTTSYTDTFPENEGETNFSRELDLPYARVKGGIAILFENEWYMCKPTETK